MSREPTARAGFSVRALASMTMVFAFSVLALSGLLMYFWRALPTREPLGLDRGQWQALHIVLSLLVVLTAAIHVGYNWGAIKHYLRRRRAFAPRPRREWAVALALVAVVAAGSAAGVPPFSLLVPKHEHHGPPPEGQAQPVDRQPLARPTA